MPQVEILPDSETDEPQWSKPKKVKVKMQDEMNIAMKGINVVRGQVDAW